MGIVLKKAINVTENKSCYKKSFNFLIRLYTVKKYEELLIIFLNNFIVLKLFG